MYMTMTTVSTTHLAQVPEGEISTNNGETGTEQLARLVEVLQ